jgi:nucleotide-binding universal stress UspA family protein
MNTSIHRILVPLDLSETSLNALETAVSIAKKESAQLYILNVKEPRFGIQKEEHELLISDYATSEDVLSALAGSVEHAHELQPQLLQKEGIPFDCILSTATEKEIDLIVMGSNGASGYRNGYAGSNTYSVMKHAVCPVLSVPPRYKGGPFKRVLFPIRPVSGALMRYDVLCHFIQANATIDVLGLSYRRMEIDTNVLEKIVNEIRDQADEDRVKVRTCWSNGETVAEDVLSYANQNIPDLVVLTNILDVTTKHGFIGPHTQTIVNNAKVPVLCIKGMHVASFA